MLDVLTGHPYYVVHNRVRDLSAVSEVVVKQNDSELCRDDLGADLYTKRALTWSESTPTGFYRLNATPLEKAPKDCRFEAALDESVPNEARPRRRKHEIASRQADDAKFVATNTLVHLLVQGLKTLTLTNVSEWVIGKSAARMAEASALLDVNTSRG